MMSFQGKFRTSRGSITSGSFLPRPRWRQRVREDRSTGSRTCGPQQGVSRGIQAGGDSGKRWKQQAPPNFEKSRQYFSAVLENTTAEGTETAARCQYQIAETHLIEKKLDVAIKEFYKVVHLHNAYPALGAEALFKAALCHAELETTHRRFVISQIWSRSFQRPQSSRWPKRNWRS